MLTNAGNVTEISEHVSHVEIESRIAAADGHARSGPSELVLEDQRVRQAGNLLLSLVQGSHPSTRADAIKFLNQLEDLLTLYTPFDQYREPVDPHSSINLVRVIRAAFRGLDDGIIDEIVRPKKFGNRKPKRKSLRAEDQLIGFHCELLHGMRKRLGLNREGIKREVKRMIERGEIGVTQRPTLVGIDKCWTGFRTEHQERLKKLSRMSNRFGGGLSSGVRGYVGAVPSRTE
jgi:hypothetical protein